MSLIDDMKAPAGQVIFGYGGDGKTTYARMAAEATGWERTLWLNTDRPLEFDAPLFSTANPFGVIDLLQDTSVDTLKDTSVKSPPAVETAVKALKQAKVAARHGKWLYDLVVLDGISESERTNFAQLDERITAKDKRQVWMAQGGDLQELVWTLRSGRRSPPTYLGANVIITARVREVPDPVTPKDEHGEFNMRLHPAVRGDWGTQIEHYYNQVLFLHRSGAQRQMYLKPIGRVHIKNDWEDALGPPMMRVDDRAKANAFVEVMRLHNRFK